jgi:S1-C subfamily serine protease
MEPITDVCRDRRTDQMTPQNPFDQTSGAPQTPAPASSQPTPPTRPQGQAPTGSAASGGSSWSSPAPSWETATASPWARPTTPPAGGWQAASTPVPPTSQPVYQHASPVAAPAPAPLKTGPSRTRRAAGTVLGTALLAAVVASGSTLAIVELTVPHGGAASPSAAPNAAVATQGSNPTTVQQDDITGVVARVKDSVVTLTSTISTGRGPFGDQTGTGIGTGIILTADGYVLTNRHVVEGSQSLKATLADGKEYSASVVKIAEDQDLALVKVDATGLKPATIGNSDQIQVGQTAIAIGSPLGTFTETVTRGIVSALDRSITVQDELTGRPTTLSGLIQTDAAINPGNSGGPLLNAAGEVVGVNTAVAAQAEGIGFAIPIKDAQSLIDQARTASVA